MKPGQGPRQAFSDARIVIRREELGLGRRLQTAHVLEDEVKGFVEWYREFYDAPVPPAYHDAVARKPASTVNGGR